MNDAIDAPGADITAGLAHTASRIAFSALPASTIECAKDLVVDHLGVALRGWTLPWTTIVRETALAERAAPVAMLYDGGRTSARNAALVNGTAGHALELDDTHDRSLTHPGSVVIPAALAVGEDVGATGAQVLAAIVAGYDVQCRLGIALGRDLIERGMHPTATLGVFGAAAAAGHLLTLEPARMAHAFGIAASMSAGLMQFSQDPEGTMVKRLYGGLPAERGVLAAQLAARGLTGPRAAIEGTFGIARMLAGRGEIDPHAFSAGPGHEIERVSIKLFACCKNFHALIEAAQECRAGPGFAPQDIAQVDVYGPRAMIDHHLERRPRSTMAAQYSLPYTTAVALIGDPHAPESFRAPAYDREDLVALAAKVSAHLDPELDAAFPRHFAGGIRVRLHDGRQFDAQVMDALGTPVRPLERAGYRAKFTAMTQERLTATAQRTILDAGGRMDDASSLALLVQALAGGAAG